MPPDSAIADDEIHLWLCAPAAVAEARLAEYRALLQPEEARRVARAVRAGDRRVRLISTALLRTVLARYTGADPRALRFRRTPQGRPELEDGPPFSLTHTGELVACAVAGAGAGEIGVDAERVLARDLMPVARRYFSAPERERLEALPAERRAPAFCDYWVLKEAYTKALGVGLSFGLRRFVVRLEAGDARIEAASEGVRCDCWLGLLQPTAEHRLGLALVGGAAQPRLRVWQAVPLGEAEPASPALLAQTRARGTPEAARE